MGFACTSLDTCLRLVCTNVISCSTHIHKYIVHHQRVLLTKDILGSSDAGTLKGSELHTHGASKSAYPNCLNCLNWQHLDGSQGSCWLHSMIARLTADLVPFPNTSLAAHQLSVLLSFSCREDSWAIVDTSVSSPVSNYKSISAHQWTGAFSRITPVAQHLLQSPATHKHFAVRQSPHY